MNNKVYFKKDAWSKSSAPWILDEPVNTQDFWALRYFGTLFHEGVGTRGSDHPAMHVIRHVKMAFRCDISYPQRQRDILDGVLDVNVCGGAFRQYHDRVMDRQRRNDGLTFNYGSANNIDDSNVQPAAWCLDTWCLGGSGVVPWQTVGNDKSWNEADPLSLFYPATIDSGGPLPSIRLKAFRRGQQDVEYLTMLGAQKAHAFDPVREAARRILRLSGQVSKPPPMTPDWWGTARSTRRRCGSSDARRTGVGRRAVGRICDTRRNASKTRHGTTADCRTLATLRCHAITARRFPSGSPDFDDKWLGIPKTAG